jgi:hypothetical protein
VFGYGQYNLFAEILKNVICYSFQEASKKLIGSNSFHQTLNDCLQHNNYIEIISDYVGSNIVRPIWLYIYVLNTTMQSQRVKILNYNKGPILKVYQVNIFYLYEEMIKKPSFLG